MMNMIKQKRKQNQRIVIQNTVNYQNKENMVKYLNTINGSYLHKFNKETEEIKSLENISPNIDRTWIADEDGELDGKEIKAGDVIFRMYGIEERYGSEREYIIIKDEALIDHYKRLKASYDEPKKSMEENCDCEAVSCGPTTCA